MGKNTMMRYCVEKYLEETGDTRWECLVKPGRKGLLEGNVGIVFTNGDLSQVRQRGHGRHIPAQLNLTTESLKMHVTRAVHGVAALLNPGLLSVVIS